MLCAPFLFFEQGTFFKAGIEPATRGFLVPCYTNLATKFFAVRAFKFFQDAFSYCMQDSNPPLLRQFSGVLPNEANAWKTFCWKRLFSVLSVPSDSINFLREIKPFLQSTILRIPVFGTGSSENCCLCFCDYIITQIGKFILEKKLRTHF